MLFKKIRFKNFLSFENAELDLHDQGFCLLQGINNFDNTASNGAGKSTCAEALAWCLTGETIRGTKDIQNYITKGKVEVTLELENDNHNYKITRTKEPSNLFIIKDGVDISGKGIRDTEVLLENEFPDLTADILGNIIILGQGMPKRFTGNTPVKRKEILETLTKSDFMIEDIKNRIDEQKERVKTELREAEDNLLKTTTQKTALQKERTHHLENLETLLKEDVEALKKEESDITSSNKEAYVQIENLNKKSEIYQQNESNLNDTVKQLLTTFNEEKAKAIEESKDLATKKREEISLLKSEGKALNDKIFDLKNIKDICPTCNQKLPDVHKVDTSEMEKELELLKSKTVVLIEEETELNKQVQKIREEWESKNPTKDLDEKLKSIREQKQMDSSEINSLNNQIKQRENRLLEVSKIISNLESNKKYLNERISAIDKEQEQLDTQISQCTIDLENLKKEQSTINSVFAYATKEFRTLLLEDIILQVQDLSKKYSKLLWDNDLIEFKQEGQSIYIGYNGKEFESLSGGEQQRVNIIIQFAIREFLLNFGLTSNILILDEIYTGLDQDGINKVNELIASLGAESVFVITHHDTQCVPYDKVITIIKNNEGISEVSLYN